jgi:hypothetical protein
LNGALIENSMSFFLELAEVFEVVVSRLGERLANRCLAYSNCLFCLFHPEDQSVLPFRKKVFCWRFSQGHRNFLLTAPDAFMEYLARSGPSGYSMGALKEALVALEHSRYYSFGFPKEIELSGEDTMTLETEGSARLPGLAYALRG